MKHLKFLTTINYKSVLSIYKYVLRVVSAFFILSAVAIVIYSFLKPSILSREYAVTLASIVVVSSIFASIGSFKPTLLEPALVSLSVAVNVIGAFPQLSLYLLYFLPIILSLYTFDKSIIKHISIHCVVFFTFSVNVRAWLNAACVELGLISRNFQMIFGTSFVAIFEVLVMLVSSLPLFLYLINANHDQYIFIKEKKAASSDILSFCSAVSVYHNRYLEAHIEGVRDITKILLDGLIEDGVKINKYYYDQIIFSVQFHDIGKTYIPPAILDKPGPLTDEEFTLIKEHPKRGLDLLDMLPKNAMDEYTAKICRNVVYMHHERLDGSGYPQGLKYEVPFEAQIIAVADVTDALLAWRPYKNPMTFERMKSVFEKNANAYNPACLKVIYRKKDEILEVSDRNNKKLMEVLKLDSSELERR